MENINLSMKEARRYEVMQGAIAGRKTMAEASQLLGVRERQCYRIKAAIIKKGIRGAIHGNRGRQPWNALPADVEISKHSARADCKKAKAQAEARAEIEGGFYFTDGCKSTRLVGGAWAMARFDPRHG